MSVGSNSAHAHAHVHTHTHMHMTCTHAHVHTHTHTHTHVHTHHIPVSCVYMYVHMYYTLTGCEYKGKMYDHGTVVEVYEECSKRYIAMYMYLNLHSLCLYILLTIFICTYTHAC